MLLRPGTSDHEVWRECCVTNVYRLPDDITGQRVLDIGANIGCFALACLHRGAAHVHCYEADIRHYELALTNLQGEMPGRVTVWHRAVWDRPALLQCRQDQVVLGATGGSPVQAVALDNIIEGQGPFDRMKLDVESAEYAILYGSKLLEQVPMIALECHQPTEAPTHSAEAMPRGPEANTTEALATYLTERGYAVETIRDNFWLWRLFATRLEDS